MAHCKLTPGLNGNLIWDTVLACDNAECEYHNTAREIRRAGVHDRDNHEATVGALALSRG